MTTLITHLTATELAARWHKKTGTLQNWRIMGKGPGYIKLGNTVLYPLAEIEAHEQANFKRNTGQ